MKSFSNQQFYLRILSKDMGHTRSLTPARILEKYKDTPFKDGKALPNYTNQAMNRDIKELCRLAGINEEIRVTTNHFPKMCFYPFALW